MAVSRHYAGEVMATSPENFDGPAEGGVRYTHREQPRNVLQASGLHLPESCNRLADEKLTGVTSAASKQTRRNAKGKQGDVKRKTDRVITFAHGLVDRTRLRNVHGLLNRLNNGILQ
jgi:hypothetical protein